MGDRTGDPAADALADLDPTTPNVARMYDFFLGGKDNFRADRQAAAKVAEVLPDVAAVARTNREFLQRAVRYVAEAGVDQFLDLGSGLPTQGNVHEIARAVHPHARVVYVDHDPVVVAHGQALLSSDERTATVRADLRDPEAVLNDPRTRRLIDFDRPVGLLIVAVLHFVPDEEDPAGLVRRYRDVLAPGSHVILSHAAIEEQRNLDVSTAYRGANARFIARTRDQVAAFLDGMDVIEPGVVHLREWRPTRVEKPLTAGWTAVARTR
ncbi:SAM-dependent methyltransferase [Actinoallomurus rhizosphaericola]|uniref:SAM-dependent methyltransferase n=1 Tax=Actinoallomurus rhizosphaericola TaxID=2952536 RepID=UPI002093C9BA|nr:SAM-dependent methyltransferase [Actinoallomurus rhizosphaericola]MCO5999525.1 SAM-dependent methyltransferase [Actinoallomurus rhizosphaericola]